MMAYQFATRNKVSTSTKSGVGVRLFKVCCDLIAGNDNEVQKASVGGKN